MKSPLTRNTMSILERYILNSSFHEHISWNIQISDNRNIGIEDKITGESRITKIESFSSYSINRKTRYWKNSITSNIPSYCHGIKSTQQLPSHIHHQSSNRRTTIQIHDPIDLYDITRSRNTSLTPRTWITPVPKSRDRVNCWRWRCYRHGLTEEWLYRLCWNNDSSRISSTSSTSRSSIHHRSCIGSSRICTTRVRNSWIYLNTSCTLIGIKWSDR